MACRPVRARPCGIGCGFCHKFEDLLGGWTPGTVCFHNHGDKHQIVISTALAISWVFHLILVSFGRGCGHFARRLNDGRLLSMSDGEVEAGRFRRKRWDSKTRTCGGQEDVSWTFVSAWNESTNFTFDSVMPANLQKWIKASRSALWRTPRPPPV